MSQIQEDQLKIASIAMRVISQVGCGTLLLIGIALGAGLWLDGLLDTGRILTVIFLVGSAPASMYLIFRIWLSSMKEIQKLSGADKSEMEDKSTE